MKAVSIRALYLLLLCFASLFAGGKDMLKIGDKAPDFSLPDAEGDTVRLSDFAGKNFVVLFFYPGDETPGCTKQLCAVRDDYAVFQARNAVVFGVNPGNSRSHTKFIRRYKFQFPLLVDERRKTAKAYGCGNGLLVKRTVYVVDPRGTIIYAKRGMPPNEEIVKILPEKTE